MEPDVDSKRPGEGDPCPICGSKAGVVADDEGYLCLVCGAPRVLVTSVIPRPGGEKRWLEEAKKLRLRRAGLTIVAGIAVVVALAAFGIGGVLALLVHFGDAARIVWSATVLIPMFVAFIAYRKAALATESARAAIEEAEVVITEELVRARGSLDAAEIASLLGVTVERAEALLGRAQLDKMLEQQLPERLRVRDDAPDGADASSSAEREREQTR